MKRLIAALFGLLLCTGPAWALDSGLALTPPMGWAGSDRHSCNVNQDMIRAAADALVSSGMRDAGYRYVIVGDCWQGKRDQNGAITADAGRFPSGMKALADYVHRRGLKFGIDADAGDGSCHGRPGSRGYELQDAQTFAAWGVDYLQYEWCASPPDAYRRMRDAIAATHRGMVFSISDWGFSHPWDWAPAVGNLWRTAGDIADCFSCPGRPPSGAIAPAADDKGPPFLDSMGLGVLQIADMQE